MSAATARLAVQAGSRRLASEAADADGLVMTMTEAAAVCQGPARTRAGAVRRAVCKPARRRICARQRDRRGRPAFDCGDRLTLTEPGEASGLTVAETIVTHRVWKFRGGGTLKGVGENPYLAAARDKSSAALQHYTYIYSATA